MNLPNQAAPIERIISTATVGSENGDVTNGVEASGIFDDIMSVVRTVAPVAGPLLGSLV